MEPLTFKEILDSWSRETIARIISVMNSKNIYWRGTLQRSIIYELGEDNVKFLMADYGRYIDEGIGIYGPTNKPLDKKFKGALAFHLKPWADSKGLKNWAVATNIIKRGGIRPKPFFRSTIENEIANIPVEDSIFMYLDDMVSRVQNESI